MLYKNYVKTQQWQYEIPLVCGNCGFSSCTGHRTEESGFGTDTGKALTVTTFCIISEILFGTNDDTNGQQSINSAASPLCKFNSMPVLNFAIPGKKQNLTILTRKNYNDNLII